MNFKIITPLSHLSKLDEFKNLVKISNGLEARDIEHSKRYNELVKFYHSELELTQGWSKKNLESLKKTISKYPNLQFVSFHMVTNNVEYILENGVAKGIGKPLPENHLLENSKINVAFFKKEFPTIEILVENNNDLGAECYKIVTDPKFISEVVNTNEILFLFDYAHAYISSINQRTSFSNYVRDLPLARLKQVHLSGYGYNNDNEIFDAHELPDKDQIEYIMSNLSVDLLYITIEFYKNIKQLLSITKLIKTMGFDG